MRKSVLESTKKTKFPALPKLVVEIQRALDLAQPEDMPRAICAVLREHASVDGLLNAQQQNGSEERYTRHVLHSHPTGLYTIVALVWRPGQITPVHGHYTWCAYIVLKGSMQEEHFLWDRERKCAVRQGEVIRRPGDTVASHAGLEEVHRLRNAGDEVSISIHVYGIDAQRISTHVNRLAMLA